MEKLVNLANKIIDSDELKNLTESEILTLLELIEAETLGKADPQ